MPRRRYAGREARHLRDSVRCAHSGPSHRHLRHRCAITCCRRAPPPARVRGWTRPPAPGLPALLPTMAIIPPGHNAGMVIFLMNVVAAGGLCGRMSLRMNVFAAGCRCGGMLLRRGQGVTPAAFYLGLCHLRGILSPPASHNYAAGGPFLTATAMTLQRFASLGLKSRIDAVFGLFLRVSLH